MTEAELHRWLVWAVFAGAGLTVLVLLLLSAPYGRHERSGWGPTVPTRWAWVGMEFPSVFVFLGVYLLGDGRGAVVPLMLLLLWQVHYINRTFIFPFRLRAGNKRMPLVLVAMGAAFNGLNSYVNARWISHLGSYQELSLLEPRVVIGGAVFLLGFLINQHADHVLLHLRRPGETGYRIPQGGAFRFVTSPNYLGEIIEWSGWAIAAGSLAGWSFVAFSVANLAPRAWSHHRWYRSEFPDYPRDRKALIPYLL